MRVRMSGPYFRALHEERAIGLFLDVGRLEWLREAGPPGTGIVLVERAEQRLSGHDVYVDPFLMIVPKLVLEGSLGALVLCDFVLQRRQCATQVHVTRPWLDGIHGVASSLGG